MTAKSLTQKELILCVGDTTFLDYGGIKKKRQGYSPQGNGGNGLLLHSALAVDPEQGQPLGLLWQKQWDREHKPKPPENETSKQKRNVRQKRERKHVNVLLRRKNPIAG